jgi:predicted DNA-binding transcriptional regulator YafY
MRTTKSQERRTRIIEFLNDNGGSTKDEIIDALKIAPRTFERDLEEINKEGNYQVEFIRKDKLNKYKIVSKEYVELEEEEILSLPILFNLMNIQKELESVLWLKDALNKHYGIDENDWLEDTYFSSPTIELSNERKVLELSISLIKHIKKGHVLTFDYKPVTPGKPIESLVIAPLQIRLYDGRYYLIGAVCNQGDYNLTNLKVMAIDQIRNWTVNQASIDDEKQTFDYKDFAKKSNLKNYFKYSIGVVVPENKNSFKKIPIRFSGWSKSYIKNKKIHHSQKLIPGHSNNDFVDVEIEVYDNFELDFVLGRFREFANRLDKPKEIISYTEYCKTCKLNN